MPEPLFNGWTPEVKTCSRCGKVEEMVNNLCFVCREGDRSAAKPERCVCLEIAGDDTNCPVHGKPTASSFCQCAHPDPILENVEAFCAVCSGDLQGEHLRLALLLTEPLDLADPLQDMADARREARFGKSL